MKVHVRTIKQYVELFRDTRSGIAWVEDGTSGCGHTCHPNIDASGSVAGMKQLGYWRREDRTIRSHGFIYNIDRLVVTQELDEIARQECRCGGNH